MQQDCTTVPKPEGVRDMVQDAPQDVSRVCWEVASRKLFPRRKVTNASSRSQSPQSPQQGVLSSEESPHREDTRELHHQSQSSSSSQVDRTTNEEQVSSSQCRGFRRVKSVFTKLTLVASASKRHVVCTSSTHCPLGVE